ncbi:MAG: LamG-like jellyroll fold domain-containing protein [Limisphaerales bacterium]
MTPPESLAEAQVSLGDQTNILFGENNNWQIGGFTFTAQTNSLPMQITGIEPGMLFDSFAVTEVPLGNLYYLPEQSLDELTGESAYGTWTLEIWDNRTGAVATNAQLVSWQMQIVLQTNAPPPVNVSPQTPTTITVLPGQIVPLFISVPSWAHFATNILDSASGPVDLLFNPTNPPTGGADDTVLINNQSAPPAIIGNPILSATSNPLLPTNSYYLGVRNNGAHAVTATVEVDFDITLLTNSVPFTDVLKTNDAGRYFSFDVSSNAFEATFQLLRLSGNADLVVSKGAPLPTLLSSDYGSFNVGNADENIYVLTNSSPVPLSAGRWFIGVIKRDSGVVHYTVLAKELTNSISSSVTIIDLTNGVPFNFTAGPGAALTNFFRFTVTNTITPTVTNYVQSIHFELYHLTGNGDLTVQTNVPPFAPPFFQSSRQPGTIPEFIQIHTNSALTNLAAAWYLGVPDDETNLINFTILAVIDTNNVFPAFPGAEGAGAGALGGGSLPARGGFTNNTVYHVINLNDSGPGSLRDAVSSTNRTIVFDVSGILFLQSPLVITNSYLTIAGQTAPGGGVTVAGQMTELQSVHDVIVRDVRFHFGGALTSTAVVWANGFENVNGSPTVAGMTGSVAGWTIVSGDIDLLGPDNGAHSIPYEGSYFIDLNGWGPGEISTNIPTIPGVNYALNFAYTRNPDSGVIPEADVSINGTLLTNVVTDYTNTDSNLDWHLMSAPFTATSSSTLLDFTATSPGASGVLLDAVSLTTNVAINASTSDSLQFNTVSNVIADHISALWSTNEDLSVLNSTNVTVQWSIISDSLNDTNLLHGYGSLLRYGGGALSLHHNLYADNYNASPRLGDNINLDFVNNVIYDWGTNAGFSTNDIADNPAGFTNELNYIGNYLIASTNSFLKNIAFWGGSTNTWIYQTNNFIDSNTNGILDGANTGWNMFTNKFTKFDRQFPLPPVSVDEAFLAYEKVLDFAGPDMGQRDWADTNIISKVRSQTGQIISIRPTIGLVAWWKGESNILDSAGTNNGTVTQGTVGYAPAEVGLGFSFNGGANRIAVPNAPALNFGANKDFSIEAWISPLTNNQGSLFSGVMTIVDKRVAPNTSQCLGYELSLASGVLNLRISQSLSGNGVNWIAGPDLRDGKMHHVAVTLVRNLTTGGHMYVDGVQVLQFDPTSQSGDLSNTNSLLIGNHPTSGLFTYFDGRIDELSIYKRALSADEIQSIYQIGRAGKFYTDTRPYLDTDQDGIPDFWEDTFGTDPFSPNPNGVTDGSGYTELEEYINWLAAPHALTITNTPVGVDLQHLFGQTGNLSFFVTNGVNGTVYLTNVLGSVTNTGTFSNTIAIFTPTNNASGGTNFYGYASFDAYVTNNDTIAYFGPVTVSVVVGNVRTITINSNMPPVITVLTNGVLDPTNYSGSDFYQISVETNVIGLLVNVTNIVPSGAADLLLAYGRLPSLSDYDYISTNTANESIFVSPNSTPVSLTNGDWYAAVVNVNRSGDPVSYDIEYQKYLSAYPPLFNYPTNGSSFTNIETTLFNINCLATDTNTPPLPLTYALVSGPIGGGLSINATTGAIDWTPTEAQGPSTNSISVSVSNGAYSVTNSFTIIVEESNLPPVLPSVPNQVVIVPGTLVVTNTATDPDIPTNPLTYMLTSTVLGTNTPGIDTNGIITWTPTLAQAGTNYLFTTIVTDTNQWAVNSKSLSATNYFYVTVATGATNGVPQTNSVPPGGINWLPVRVPTNAIAATNILLYATNLPVNVWFSANVPPTITNANDFILLPNAMSGMSVLTTNSAPTNIVPGGIYFLGVQNTNSVAVTYDLEVNFGFISSTNAATNAIFISSIIYTNGGFLLTWFAPTSDVFQAQETASLTPPISWNTFSNIITYASLTPTNGMFTFFDNGSQFPFGPMRYYRLLLLQATNTLILPRQTNYIANVGMPLTITNTATDSNAGAILNYVLTSFPLPSTPATIAANGIITWTPGAGDSGGAFKFITAVTDNSAPPLSATNAFTVFVLPPPAISNVVATATNVTLRWLAPTNDIFQVEWTTNLTPVVDWIPFPPTITSTDSFFTFTDTNAPLATKFYRLLWLPLP